MILVKKQLHKSPKRFKIADMEIASDTKDHTEQSILGTKVKLREGRSVFDHATISNNNYPVRTKLSHHCLAFVKKVVWLCFQN